ncbi:LacI family transcriptional regulator [Nocardiopsis kunsanensis]|uniref:LacI family transcriptional regulator n=2 Tax=Nocardiopsis kunsanensis TaxID=141693 RepID=A0A918X6P8_9ACTN|nr:LacI family transcriptional regulator [Nocardiopsis kunsanensis]
MPTTGGRSPVMSDVAKVAGVSHQTVSRVVNGHPNVREETVVRVRRAIAELGYQPNSTARALVTRRTNVLGALAVDTTLFGPAQTLAGIERAAREAGYFLSIVSVDDLSPDGVAEALDHLVQQAVEGCVAITPQRELAHALAALPGPRPLVAVEGGEGAGFPVVGVDQEQGARDAVRHLVGLGHRTVHHVAGRADWLEAEARVHGWREELLAAGHVVPEPLAGDWSPRSGYELGHRLAERRAAGEEVTAVFVANDQMAVGVLKAFHEVGLRVPDDVSVVGFDDIPESAYLTPGLTTVVQDFTRVGTAALEVLLGALESPDHADTPVDRTVPAVLRVRDSSAPPSA